MNDYLKFFFFLFFFVVKNNVPKLSQTHCLILLYHQLDLPQSLSAIIPTEFKNLLNGIVLSLKYIHLPLLNKKKWKGAVTEGIVKLLQSRRHITITNRTENECSTSMFAMVYRKKVLRKSSLEFYAKEMCRWSYNYRIYPVNKKDCQKITIGNTIIYTLVFLLSLDTSKQRFIFRKKISSVCKELNSAISEYSDCSEGLVNVTDIHNGLFPWRLFQQNCVADITGIILLGFVKLYL